MITKTDIIEFLSIANKKEKLSYDDEDVIKKFFSSIITYQDWNMLYLHLTGPDATWLTWIKRTYEVCSLLLKGWYVSNNEVFNSLFAIWTLSDGKRGMIHNDLVEYVINFIQNTKEKASIKYVLETFWNIPKIREAGERKMKETTKEDRR